MRKIKTDLKKLIKSNLEKKLKKISQVKQKT